MNYKMMGRLTAQLLLIEGLFLIPALLIPLVPGRPLYYAMYYAVQQDMDLSADFARQTALYALGIALGASLVWALADMRRHLKQNGFGN